MKDITISAKRIRRELWVLLASFIVAYGVNVFAIIHWNRPMSEYWMTIGYVIVIALSIYVASVFVRLVIAGCVKLIKHFVKH